MFQFRKPFVASAILCFLICIVFVFACGGNSASNEKAPELEKTEAGKAADSSRDSGTMAAEDPKAVLGDWKEAYYEEFIFMIPQDWKEDSDAGVWFPPSENFDMGLPDISLQCGDMPVMPGQSVDVQIKELLLGSDPTVKTPVNKCDIPGHIREAQDEFGLRHIALTLEEMAGGDMIMVHFFNCRVPAARYDQYAEIFRKILDSVRCKS